MPKSFARRAIYASPEFFTRAELAASEREMSLSAWFVQAGLSYLATHEKNRKGKYKQEKKLALTAYGYPIEGRCFICKEACHSEGPLEYHNWEEGSTLKPSEIQYGFDHLQCDEEAA